MEETRETGGNHLLTEFQIQIIRQKLELMKLEYQSETVNSFRLYPRVTSAELDTEPDMARRCTNKDD
jgi:hypothetical protein